MEYPRTPRHDGSERHCKKATTHGSSRLLADRDALAGFIALFGDGTVDLEGVVGRETFFEKTIVRDLTGSDEAFITGRAVPLSEVV